MKPVVALVVVGLVALAGVAHAANPEQAATELSHEIMSPFCPGVTLHECPSAEALQLRDRIEDWFAAGLSRDDILARLASEYGDGIRATPAAEGAGLGAWLMIAAAVVVALATAVLLIRRWARRPAAEETIPVTGSADRRRLDDELARLRAGS